MAAGGVIVYEDIFEILDQDADGKGWPKTISTKNPDTNATNILSFDGKAMAQ